MAVLMTTPVLRFFKNDGSNDPLSGGKVFTYTATGTFSTYKATYTTQAGDVEHTNPVILDANGVPENGGSIWLDGGNYDIVVKDENDVVLSTTLNQKSFLTTEDLITSYEETFSGDGVTTAFTTSTDLGVDEKTLLVWVDNGDGKGRDIQLASSYTIDGTTLTFTTPPATGVNNILVSQPSTQIGAAAGYATIAEDASASATASAVACAGYAASVPASIFVWDFDDSTVMGNPSVGNVRLNAPVLANVTAIAISANTADSGNPDLSAYLATWADSVNSDGRGYILLKKADNPVHFILMKINADLTDNTNWYEIPVERIAHFGAFTDEDTLFCSFSRSGSDEALEIEPLPAGDIALDDKIAFADVTDSDIVKKDTVQDTFALIGSQAGASQTFTADGTWTKPSFGNYARVRCWGAGAGGSIGSRYGDDPLRPASQGAICGGGGGGYAEYTFNLSDLTSSVAITIGQGGNGAVQTDPRSNVVQGGNGGDTSFGSYVIAYGGQASLVNSPDYLLPAGGQTSLPFSDETGGRGATVDIYRTSYEPQDRVFSGGSGGAVFDRGPTQPSILPYIVGGTSQYGGNGGSTTTNTSPPLSPQKDGQSPAGGGLGIEYDLFDIDDTICGNGADGQVIVEVFF